jgi:DNA invertase Pin-like site-specific DNA recombinase
LLDRVSNNGIRLVIVEDASRFARDLLVQETGIRVLQQRGVALVTSGGDNLTDSTDSTRVMVRQILGAVAQNEKSRLVAKLKAARARKSIETGKPCGGRKGYADFSPATVDAIRAIRATDPRATLQTISDKLATDGVLNTNHNPLSLAQIHNICKANGIGKAAK